MFIINLVKKLFVSISALIAYLSFPLFAFAKTAAEIAADEAATNVNPCGTIEENSIANILCKLGSNIGGTIQGVVVFFIILAVVIALMYLLYGGVKWITSRGDKTEVESARNHIMAAIIGLIVVILAVFILTIVLQAFGISLSALKIPVI
ncbi:MAG: conserved rane protein of unknown function, partial [Candidatus Levybacteria bacterium]|nr:conserved rane protein of unknown function [Candidatus Levybacteria bacterium]